MRTVLSVGETVTGPFGTLLYEEGRAAMPLGTLPSAAKGRLGLWERFLTLEAE
ncbi:MAG: hypothetical protein KTR29_10260 [Rhodothermaceae bacterium]|nr:hypothetical protein [Rhodothermaceae bacterium]